VTDGLAELLLLHGAAVLSSVHLNFVQRDYRRCCQIVGTRGSIYWDFSERRVWTFGEDGKLAQTFPEPVDWTVNQMYLDELTHFLGCVRAARPTMNPLAQGRETLALALAAREPRWRIGLS
jgi:predicted dehydrogenase